MSPPRLAYRPFWPCVPSFSRFVGVPFWAPGRFGVFGFSRNIGGLEITRPLLRPPFLGRGAAWVFIVDSPFVDFVFPLLLCFAAFSRQLEGADPSSNEAYPRVIAPAPHVSEGPGSAIARGRLPTPMDTAFRDTFFASLCLVEGRRDPRDRFWRGGGVCCLLRPFFHTHVCFSHAPGFFCGFFVCFPLAFEAQSGERDAIQVGKNGVCIPRTKCRIPRAVPRMPRNARRYIWQRALHTGNYTPAT